MGKTRSKVTYLLCKKSRNEVYVLSPNTYGMDTWGSSEQDSLEKKRKYWYICSWWAGNDWYDDGKEEYKLNVLLETQSPSELLKLVKLKYPHCLESVKEECAEIVRQYDMFERWILNAARK